MAFENKLCECYINNLSNILLSYIFSFMTIKERVYVERVCKHWRVVNVDLPWVDFHHLEMNEENISVSCFQNILNRCGSNLLSLEIVDFASSSFPSDWLEIIANFCPKLKSLNYQISRLDKANPRIACETLNFLSEHCKGLQQLNLRRRQFTDEGVKCLLKNCQLQAINFTFNQSLNGECFRVISDDVQCIVLHGCWSLTSKLEYIRLCKNLRYLDISNCSSLKSLTVTKVLQSVGSSLRKLSMGKNPQYTEALWSIPCYCKRLKSLNLFSLSQVRHDLIEALSKNCIRLETLSVSKTSIDDKSLFAMRNMIFLTSLSIAATQVTDVGLFVLSQKGCLEKLVASYCENIGDPGCIAIIRNCKNLKQLDVSYCAKVTDATINDAVKVRKSNLQKLVVFAYMTSIQNVENPNPWFIEVLTNSDISTPKILRH